MAASVPRHTYPNSNSYSDCYAKGDGDGHTYSHTGCYSDTWLDSDSDTERNG